MARTHRKIAEYKGFLEDNEIGEEESMRMREGRNEREKLL
jgi:hypothetical protein